MLPALVALLITVAALLPSTRVAWSTDDSYVLYNLESSEWRRWLFAFNVDRPSDASGAWWDGALYNRRFVRVTPSAIMAGEVRLVGHNARRLHLVSLSIHLLNTLLILSLAHRWLRHPWKAALVATVFGVHPVNFEAVGWFACQPLLLAMTFGLTTIHTWIRYRTHPSNGRLWAAVVCMLITVTSYEAAVVLPIVIILADVLISREINWPRPRWAAYAALLSVWVPYFLLTAWNSAGTESHETMYRPTPGEVWYAARLDLSSYVFKALGLIPPRTPNAYWVYNALGEPLAPLLVCFLVGAIAWWARRRTLALVGLIAFFALLTPPWLIRATVGTLNVPTLRQLYLPLIGVAAMLAGFVQRARVRTAAVLLVPVVLVFTFLNRQPHGGGVGSADGRAPLARALEGTDPSLPIIISGTFETVAGRQGCPYDPRLDFPERQRSFLIPPTLSGRPPELVRHDAHSFTAVAPDAFVIAEERRPPSIFGRYNQGWMRLPLAAPPLLATGSQRLGDVLVELVGPPEHPIRRLRFTFDKPLAGYVVVHVSGCRNVLRLA